MSDLPYATLAETNSTPRGSVFTVDSLDTIHHTGNDHTEYLCRVCKNKLIKKQEPNHTPIDCLNQRCEILETEAIKLKDHDIKSRIQIKELENKITSLEEAIKGLTAPKQQQAAPFNFNSGQKLRNPFKKAQSVDVPIKEPEINYDNILPPKRSSSRERIGLFGSLGASSQHR
jgi:CRISPR/Cas system-associated protein Cas10 (large subunit of type III CRISPR-Cas system)